MPSSPVGVVRADADAATGGVASVVEALGFGRGRCLRVEGALLGGALLGGALLGGAALIATGADDGGGLTDSLATTLVEGTGAPLALAVVVVTVIAGVALVVALADVGVDAPSGV